MTSESNNGRGFMAEALMQARLAADRGEVPVGAVVVKNGTIIARAGNETLQAQDPSAHAEIVALRRAAQATGSHRLIGCDLYVTLEPCPMCAAAISIARIRRLYYGATDAKGGAVESGVRLFHSPTCHHAPEVYGGVEEGRSAALLKAFFAERRQVPTQEGG